MKNNQVYINPADPEGSMRQLQRFYRLDDKTLRMVRRVVEHYPKPIILYVDEANAPLMANSFLDDLFTFNTETGELVLFSSDPQTFIDATIEMWMYISGFETLMGSDGLWQTEFAIGAWKPVRDNIKGALGIPNQRDIQAIVGLPPDPDEAPLEDPDPFKTLVSTMNLIAFMQMIRLAGRGEVRVQFPPETHPSVIEAYFDAKYAIQRVGKGLTVRDAETFNTRLAAEVRRIEEKYKPDQLPLPAGWDDGDDRAFPSDDNRTDDGSEEAIALSPESEDEPSIGKLLTDWTRKDDAEIEEEFDREFEQWLEPNSTELFDPTIEALKGSPFEAFIETLFDD